MKLSCFKMYNFQETVFNFSLVKMKFFDMSNIKYRIIILLLYWIIKVVEKDESLSSFQILLILLVQYQSIQRLLYKKDFFLLFLKKNQNIFTTIITI